MPIKRLTVNAALVSVLLLSGSLHAKTSTVVDSPVIANVTPSLLNQLSIFNPAQMLAQSIVPTLAMGEDKTAANHVATDGVAADQADGLAPAATGTGSIGDLRKALIAMAMKLRDIRYVRGGHDPSTGFDCSGFVRYVFAHAVGMQLPTNSAAQFLAGLKVKRDDMKPGDLVFFHTHGKRRISHVGIYIADGRFIHSPTTGKSVQISSLDETYWAKHFAGAKRPEGIALLAHNG
ncbi:MAG TPA: C40 family peptidase [Rhodanobacter sp.]